MYSRNLILGAGIAGLSCSYHLNDDSLVLEKRDRIGGLLDNFTLPGGFRFDNFVHLSFTSNEYVKKLFDKSVSSIEHQPKAYNLTNGQKAKHPIQFNLSQLPAKERIEIIKDFILKPSSTPKNYDEWCKVNFGNYFTENYIDRYTKKYWLRNAHELNIEWIGSRVKPPSLEQILNGAFEEDNENHFYAKQVRYPLKGGYKSYLKELSNNAKVNLNSNIVKIDLDKRLVFLKDTSDPIEYKNLISSIPLNEIIRLIKDCPLKVKNAAKKLAFTSGKLISIGFNRKIKHDLWTYLYDLDFKPARVYSPSVKSPENAPLNKSSLQFEFYFDWEKKNFLPDNKDILKNIYLNASKYDLFRPEDVEVTDIRDIKYANIIFDFNRKESVKTIKDYLESHNVTLCGRFGLWEYYWSDDSLISGMEAANKINSK